MVILYEFSNLTNHIVQFCLEHCEEKSKCVEESDQNKTIHPARWDNMATSLQFE